jgi:hypothetical protein
MLTTENKPDLSQVAEALGGGPGAAEDGSQETKLDRDRAAFDAIEKKYLKKEKAAEREEKPKPKKAEKKATEQSPSEPEAKATSEPGGNQGEEETPESRKAREFLRLRASVPESVIEKLSTEEVVAWAASSTKSVAEIDRAFMERAELQKELRDLSEAAGKPKGEEPSAVPASPSPDLKEIESQLLEQFGEEEAKVLTRAIEPFMSRIADLEQTIESAKDSNTRQISKSNRERLSEVVPLLAESDRAWEAVEREVIATAERKPSAFTNAGDFFDDAVRALYGDAVFEKKAEPEPEPEAPEDAEEEKEARKKATPSIKTKKPAPRKLPPKESDWEVYKHLTRNPGDIRGAQRAGRV